MPVLDFKHRLGGVDPRTLGRPDGQMDLRGSDTADDLAAARQAWSQCLTPSPGSDPGFRNGPGKSRVLAARDPRRRAPDVANDLESWHSIGYRKRHEGIMVWTDVTQAGLGGASPINSARRTSSGQRAEGRSPRNTPPPWQSGRAAPQGKTPRRTRSRRR